MFGCGFKNSRIQSAILVEVRRQLFMFNSNNAYSSTLSAAIPRRYQYIYSASFLSTDLHFYSLPHF
jgi:hypothetical protein